MRARKNQTQTRERGIRAYILSQVHGTVQIGRTVYCVPTGEKFSASMKGLRKYPFVYVRENSWTAAREALQKA